MSEKVWKKVNSLKPEKTWLPLKRIMKKSELKAPTEKVKKKKLDSFTFIKHTYFYVLYCYFLRFC